MENLKSDDFLNLIVAIKNGDKNAFSLLYDKISAPLYTFILRIVKNEDIANDVLQDVFVKIWKNVSSFDSNKSKFFTWAVNIAKNSAIDSLRKKSYTSEIHNTVSNVEYNITNHKEEQNIDVIGIVDLIDKLPDYYKKIIRMGYYEGYSQTEIAERLEIPLGTVKTRARAGLKELKKLMGA